MTETTPKAIPFEDKLYAALAYPFWYFLVPFWWAFPEQRRKEFLRHHCLHSTLANLAFWLIEVLIATIGQCLGPIPFLGMFSSFFGILGGLIWLTSILFIAYGLFMALSGKRMEIEYLTPYIEQNTPNA